jgi:hypothetical protein
MSVNRATRWGDPSLDISESAADAKDADVESMLFPA